MGVTGIFSFTENQLRRTLRVFPPEFGDLLVCLFPFWNRSTPVRKNSLSLCRGPLIGRNGQDLTYLAGHGISFWCWIRRHRKPKAPNEICLTKVLIPVMVLVEVNGHERTIGICNWRLQNEDGFT